MIAIIDYDAGNLRSVEKALIALGSRPLITRDPKMIRTADQVILPGVGAYGDAMRNLQRFDLVKVVREIAAQGTPLLGICLGMQLLFTYSEENGGVEGIGILEGDILKFPPCEGLKIPHMGWNSLQVTPGARLYQGIDADPYVYFVHSYYLKAKEEAIVAASAEYGVKIHASIEKENIFGCQFHPEKSSGTGLAILRNFAGLRL